MYRRYLAAAAAAGVLLLAACSSSPSQPSGSSSQSSAGGGSKVTLTYLTFHTPDLTADFWSKSIAAAEQAVPGVTIKQDVAPTTDRDSYAKQLLQSGEFPDLLQSVTPSLYTKAGLLTPYPASWINANFILPNTIKGQDYIPRRTRRSSRSSITASRCSPGPASRRHRARGRSSWPTARS